MVGHQNIEPQYLFNEVVEEIENTGISSTCKTINQFNQIIDQQNKSSSNKDLEKIIKQDMSFSAEVLKTANSSLFRSKGGIEITDITKAINIVGWDLVQKIGMTLTVKKLIKTIKAKTFACWVINRAIDIANISEIFLDTLKYKNDTLININSVYAYGLLHDIGSLGLLQTIPDYQKDVMSVKLKDNSKTWSDAEEELYGFNHTRVGEQILIRTYLPQSFSIVSRYHHSPEPVRYNETDSKIVTLIRLAQASLIDSHKFSEHSAFSDFTTIASDKKRFREFHEFSFSLQSEFERILGLTEEIYNEIKTTRFDKNFHHEVTESFY